MANEVLVNDISGGQRYPLLYEGKLLLELLDEEKGIPITAASGSWILRTGRGDISSPHRLLTPRVLSKHIKSYTRSFKFIIRRQSGGLTRK